MAFKLRNGILLAGVCMCLGACNTVSGPRAAPASVSPKAYFGPSSGKDSVAAGGRRITGRASWYGAGFGGKRTASGERFNPSGHTAAHRTLPFGTRVLVENPKTGQSVIVRINDRGPFHGNRLIDLSRGAAQSIGLMREGVGSINMTVIAAVE